MHFVHRHAGRAPEGVFGARLHRWSRRSAVIRARRCAGRRTTLTLGDLDACAGADRRGTSSAWHAAAHPRRRSSALARRLPARVRRDLAARTRRRRPRSVRPASSFARRICAARARCRQEPPRPPARGLRRGRRRPAGRRRARAGRGAAPFRRAAHGTSRGSTAHLAERRLSRRAGARELSQGLFRRYSRR